ncbi:unnamed protein product, partial [Trichogramma brassicae]
MGHISGTCGHKIGSRTGTGEQCRWCSAERRGRPSLCFTNARGRGAERRRKWLGTHSSNSLGTFKRHQGPAVWIGASGV